MYGPPVQPPRTTVVLAASVASSRDEDAVTGPETHRGGHYSRWRRNHPYPSMTPFDAPERTFCTVRRLRTNTPLQALVTLNDPVFFFFQAEDGIRDIGVTGVQTCALPICGVQVDQA